MLFSGCAFFMAAIRALALASPRVPARVACHSASVGFEDMRLPSSLTEPISIGTFLEISGAASYKERTVITRPSRVGPIPTRGVDPAGEPIPRVRGAEGLILAAAAVSAVLSLAHSIFCSAPISLGPSPQIGQELFRQRPGLLAAGRIAAAARLHRRPMEESRRGRHAHQAGHLRTAARLAVNHDLSGSPPRFAMFSRSQRSDAT